MIDSYQKLILTVALGLSGAAVATVAGVPAAALVGSSLLVSGVAWAGVPLLMDNRLRNAAFVVIGISMGAGVEPDTMAQVPVWSLSLGILCLSILATMAVSVWCLRQFFGLGHETAVLASCPGTMSYVLAIADEGQGDRTAVLILQTLRLLMLAAALPILIGGMTELPADEPLRPVMQAIDLLAVGAASLILGHLGSRARLPAAYLIAGMVVSAIGHATGVTGGRPPEWLIFIGFALTGATLGSRFTGISRGQTVRYAAAAAAVVTLATAVSGLFALASSGLIGLPFGQSWVAYAPGGVEAMAAIGLALGYDPAYIALHHLARIVLLMLAVPVAIRIGSRI